MEVQHTGLAVYVHDSIVKFVKHRTDLEANSIECLWLEISYKHSNSFLIGFVYRNPASNSAWSDDFIDLMDTIKCNNRNVLILGDFNIDLHKTQTAWHSLTSLFGLHQLVNTSTRITDTSSTLIDHIYTNNKSMVSNVKIVPSSFSDHYSLFCSWSFKMPKQVHKGHTTIEYRSFKKFDETKFFFDLSLAPFSSVFNHLVADEALYALLDILYPIIDKHAPLRHHRVKYPSLPPWLTKTIIEAMSLRDFFKNNNMKSHFKKQRNKVTELTRQAKATYFDKLIEDKKDIKTVWRAVNNILGKCKQTSNMSATTISPDDFNNHFFVPC